MRAFRLSQEGVLAILLLITMAAQACVVVVDPDDDFDFDDHDGLDGTRWRLELIVIDGRTSTVRDGVYSLRFETDRQLSGVGDCNSYGAVYSTSRSGNFFIDDLVSTEVACDGLALENAYFDNLLDAASYRTHDDDLSFYDTDGDLLLRFRDD